MFLISYKVMNDPFLRETDGFMQSIQKRLGGVGLPKTYNVLGEPIISTQGNVGRLFNSIFLNDLIDFIWRKL